MEKQSKINIISTIILIGFVVAVFYHYILGTYLGLGYPFNTFLFIPSDRFMDFFNGYRLFTNPNPYLQHNLPANHFPFGFLVIYLFTLIPPGISFFLFSSTFILYFLFYNYKNLKYDNLNVSKLALLKDVFIISVLSYPFLFLVDRCNTEGVVFIFLSLFVYFYLKKRYLISALFLAFPIAMKLYPAIFLSLFLADKKFKEIIYAIILVGVSTMISLMVFKADIILTTAAFINHLHAYITDYAINNSGLAYGHSLFGAIKILMFKVFGSVTFWNLQNVLQIYTYACIILGVIISLHVIFIEKTFWKKVAILTLVTLIFPPVSADYKLIHLYIPLWLFINARNETKLDVIYAVLFGLMLIPKSYYIFASNVSIAVVLNPLIISTMLILLLSEGLVNKIKQYRIKNTGTLSQ